METNSSEKGQIEKLVGKTKTPFSKEVADEQIDALVKFYRIFPDDMPGSVGKGVKASLAGLRRAVMDARLEIVVDGKNIKITQHVDDPQKGVPEKIIYGKIKGVHKIGMKEDDTLYEKIYIFLGALSGEGIPVIQDLEGIDLSLAESLGTVFLQV